MKSVKVLSLLTAYVFAADILLAVTPVSFPPQKSKMTITAAPATLLTRTITRRETSRFGYGGTVTVVGAPIGSIRIEGWPRSEVEVQAEIELKAETEDDLTRLATVNSFVFDADANHISVLTTGTHDRAFMRRAAKDFPKKLLGLPWKVDYRIRVPAVTDLEINAGRGALKLSGVEGAIRLSATEGETELVLTGGVVSATLASGTVKLTIPVRSWRGGGADIRIASGDLILELPPGFSGDIDADVLRAGRIEDTFGDLEARQKPGITPTVMRARAGAGGAYFKFTVGTGTLYIKKAAAASGLRVLTHDPDIGIARHVDAVHEEAEKSARVKASMFRCRFKTG